MLGVVIFSSDKFRLINKPILTVFYRSKSIVVLSLILKKNIYISPVLNFVENMKI